MLKKLSILFIIFILLFTGCNTKGNITKKYLDALKNTENAVSMEEQLDVRIDMDTLDVNNKAKEQVEFLDNIEMSANNIIDKRNEKVISNIFLKVNDISIDSKYYINGDKRYFKPTFLSKYIELNFKLKSQKIFNEFKKQWKEIIKKEIIELKESNVIHTPNGDVNAKTFVLKLDDKKAKNMLKQIINNITLNKNTRYVFTKLILYYTKQENLEQKINNFFSEVSENFENINKSIRFDSFNVTAKVDESNFIVEDNLFIKITLIKDGLCICFNKSIKRWDINKPIRIQVPQIDDNKIIKKEDFLELNESIYLYKNLMNRKKGIK